MYVVICQGKIMDSTLDSLIRKNAIQRLKTDIREHSEKKMISDSSLQYITLIRSHPVSHPLLLYSLPACLILFLSEGSESFGSKRLQSKVSAHKPTGPV